MDAHEAGDDGAAERVLLQARTVDVTIKHGWQTRPIRDVRPVRVAALAVLETEARHPIIPTARAFRHDAGNRMQLAECCLQTRGKLTRYDVTASTCSPTHCTLTSHWHGCVQHLTNKFE